MIIIFSFTEFLYLSGLPKKGIVTLVYGAESFLFIINYLIKSVNLDLIFLSISSLVILFFLSFKFKIDNLSKIERKNETSFLIGSIILTSSFFLNMTFEYRFIYIIFTLPFLFEMKKKLIRE